MIPFNKTQITGNELEYIQDAIRRGRLSGGGYYTTKCEALLSEHLRSEQILLTSSCSSALEIAALLLNLQPGDEVIVPSFTFVTTATAFSLHGAKVVFAEIDAKTLNIDPNTIKPLISEKTKAIVAVHYAGVACKMDELVEIAQENDLVLIEDAALGFDSYYKNQSLGTIGDIGVFSFHDTKNVCCGEGGAISINNSKFTKRAQIIRDKGTNRAAFEEGSVNKYECVDLGSSYIPSELNSAFLFGQLERIVDITNKRTSIWHKYKNELTNLEIQGKLHLPFIPGNTTINGSMFFILCHDNEEREMLRHHLGKNGIRSVFHYSPLHRSPYYSPKYQGNELSITSTYADSILRLPMYNELQLEDQQKVVDEIYNFYNSENT